MESLMSSPLEHRRESERSESRQKERVMEKKYNPNHSYIPEGGIEMPPMPEDPSTSSGHGVPQEAVPAAEPIIEKTAPTTAEEPQRTESGANTDSLDSVTPVPVSSSSREPVPEVEVAREKLAAKNFKALKEKADRAERERDEYFRRLQDFENRRPVQSQSQAQAPDEDIFIAPDDVAEGKHIAKLQQQIKKMHQEMQQYKQHTLYSTDEVRVRSEMPDYDKVVSDENIELLKTMEPDLADSIAANPNLYSKAKAAYRAIKKNGIYVEDTYQKDRALVEKNMAKPRPLSSVSPQQSNSPLSHANAFANGLTKELQEQMIREMDEATRNL